MASTSPTTQAEAERLRRRNFEILERLDASAHARVHELLTAFEDDEHARLARIAAYEATLTPMTREEVTRRARRAEGDIAAGRTYSAEEVLARLGIEERA